MKRRNKALLLTLVITLGSIFTACTGDKKDENIALKAFTEAIDSEFSKDVMLTLSEFIDDPATGNRSAGSPAEKEAADYLAGKMKEIGLENVTKDETTVDGWTYKGANIKHTNTKGEEKLINLGGYATQLVTKDEKIKLVYANQGTMGDYENLDVEGKLVLIDVNQDEDWWINWPAYQAKLKGARAIIAMTEMGIEADDRLTSQDICGPADAPVFAISKNDSNTLKNELKNQDGEIEVIFNADSTVTEDTTSYNVWGEIPGKTDQVIYMIAHYDAYYRAVYDDAHGVGMTMGIMKALIDSEYVPDKTIRVVYHGAEEFGKTDSQYDWGVGAYEQIMKIHPEWVEKAFALVNIDAGYIFESDEDKGIYMASSHEISDFVQNSVGEYVEDAGYKFNIKSPVGSSTEDFIWAKQGVPIIGATRSDNNPYGEVAYHSNYDSLEKNPMDEKIFNLTHEVMGKIVLDLDKTNVRPIDFNLRMEALKESILSQTPEAKKLLEKIEEFESANTKLSEKIKEVNDSNDENVINNMNDNLYEIYKRVQEDFLKMDYNLSVGFPHEMYEGNLEGLNLMIEALENKDVKTVIDELVWMVDWAGYSMYFDEETVAYFLQQNERGKEGTWAENLMATPITNMDNVVKSLMNKYDSEDANVDSEIKELNNIKKQQETALINVLEKELKCLDDVIKMIDLL